MARKAMSEEFWTWQFISTTLGAIAAGAAETIAIDQDATRFQGSRMSRIRWNFEWGNKGSDDGPLIIGLAWNLNAAAIAEAMNADPQADDGEVMEHVRRKVFPLAIIGQISTASGRATDEITARTFRSAKLPSWDLLEGTALVLFVFNVTGGSALAANMILNSTIGIKQGWLDA